MLSACRTKGDVFSIPKFSVVMDDIDDFIEAIEACPDKTYFVSIPHSTKCWLKQPITREKTYKYAGEIRSKQIVGMHEKKLLRWKHHMITCMLAHFFLWHLKIRLGEKSTIYYFKNP